MNSAPQTGRKLSEFTTLHIGGEATYLFEVHTEAELIEALRFSASHTNCPPLLLGGGSNVLCSDVGYPGVVIVNKIKGYEYGRVSDTSVQLTAGAGEVFDEVVAKTVRDGYWGLENLSGIPGSVGATPIQNVGAYGVDVAGVIVAVEAIHNSTLKKKTFTTEECRFGYRDSFFKSATGKQWCIVRVTYQLAKVANPILSYKDLQPLETTTSLTLHTIRDHVMTVRSEKFPDWTLVGTAGSFFKNPIISKKRYERLLKKYSDLPGFSVSNEEVKTSLGWILDKVCGLRGCSRGKVGLYEKQALVLVTKPGATACEVNEFVCFVAKRVKQKTGIVIEREVLSV